MNSILSKSEKYLYPFFAFGLLVFAYQYHEWSGVIFVVSGGVMWALLHLSRVLQVFKKAANRPRNNRGRFTRNNRATRKAFAPTHVRKTRKSTRKNRKH